MQIFWIIFLQDLLLTSRQLAKILANFLFFVISVTVFLIMSQNQQNQDSITFYSITVIWFSILSALIFSASEFLKKDFEDGTIEQIITTIDNFEIFILAKMISNWLVNSLPIIISIIPLGYLSGLDSTIVKSTLFSAFFATLIINFICGFCGSLSIANSSAPLVGVIAMPLIIPVLLLGIGDLGMSNNSNLKILIGLTFFIGPITVFATAKIVKIAAE